MTDETWNSLRLIRWTTDYFEKKGIPNPRLDAELLLSHALKCKRIDLYTDHERTIPEKERGRFRKLVERRARREPLQYIIGETEFWGLSFKVTPSVLTPRPETERLVEESLKKLSPSPPQDILEIGTGSGCITIALAHHLPEAKVVATDISQGALELARENAARHQIKERVEWILADIAPWRVFQSQGRSFDLIVSNPPYIATEEFDSLQPEVRDFEPRQSLEGGPTGLKIIQQILEEAPPFLKPSGSLLLEIGEDQGAALRVLLKNHPLLTLQEIQRDYAGHDRIAILAFRGNIF